MVSRGSLWGRILTVLVEPSDVRVVAEVDEDFLLTEYRGRISRTSEHYAPVRGALGYDDARALPAGPPTITVAQAVEYTGLSKKNLRALLRNGTIRGTKVKNRWLIEWESLMQFVRLQD